MEHFICAAICQIIVRITYLSTLLWVLAALTSMMGFWLSLLVYLVGLALAAYAHKYVAPYLGAAGNKLTNVALPSYMYVRGLFTKETIEA